MGRNWILVMATAVIMFSLGGCATQYRQVAQRQVITTRTKQGEVIKIVSENYLSFEEVIERSPNVKSVTRMTNFGGEREPGFFDVSPTDPELVFQALEKVGGNLLTNIWKSPTDGGTGMTRLTSGRYFDIEPSYTPDGEDICFSSNRSSNSPKLFRVKTSAAGGITRITQADAEDRFPDPSPGGETLYYMSRPFNSMTWQVWRINQSGSLPTQLKEGSWPQVSPDGNKVLYCAKDVDSGRWKIWIMNSDGSNETQMTSGTDCDEYHPRWSPDGKKIVYATDIGKDSNGKKNFDIWVMEADGSRATQLTTNGSTDFMPVFSPDGKFIYFLSNRGFFWDIWRMEIAS